MLIRSVLVLFLAAVLAGPAAAADVYKTVDENGNVTYTDSPPQDKTAEKIQVREPNTLPAVRPRSYVGSGDGAEAEEEEGGPYNPRIASPANDYQMGPGQTSLAISVETDRPLEKGYALQLFVNGVAEGQPTQSSQLALTNVRRGRKQIVVSVVDPEGSIIASSAPVSIYVIRPNPKPK